MGLDPTFVHLLKNRFGATTRPLQSIDVFINFITNMNAMNSSIDFISSKIATEINDDLSDGLDGIVTDEDRRFMEYSRRYGEPK